MYRKGQEKREKQSEAYELLKVIEVFVKVMKILYIYEYQQAWFIKSFLLLFSSSLADEWGLKTEQHKYKCSACEAVSKTRLDIEQHIADMQKDHEEAVVVVLIGPEARGRSCPLCNDRFQRSHLFKVGFHRIFVITI